MTYYEIINDHFPLPTKQSLSSYLNSSAYYYTFKLKLLRGKVVILNHLIHEIEFTLIIIFLPWYPKPS